MGEKLRKRLGRLDAEDIIRIALLAIIAVFLLSLFISIKTGHDKAPESDEIQIPDVTSMTINQAKKTMGDDGIDFDTVVFEGGNFDINLADDLAESPIAENADGFDYTAEKWKSDVVVASQDPKAGNYRRADAYRIVLTLRLRHRALKQYRVAVAAKKEQERQEDETRRAREAEQAAAREAQIRAERQALDSGFSALKAKISAGQCSSVNSCLSDVNALGVAVKYLSSSSYSEVSSEVYQSPDEWRFTIDTTSDSIDLNAESAVLYVEEIPYSELHPDVGVSSSGDGLSSNLGSSGSYSDNDSGGSGSNRWQYYKNCKQVWNALGHGITSSDPGYSRDLDADGDGRACEVKPNY